MKMHLYGNRCCPHITKWRNIGAYEIKPERKLTSIDRFVTCKVCLKMVADIKTRMQAAKKRKP